MINKRWKPTQRRRNRGERKTEIVFLLFEATMQGVSLSSHEVALQIGLTPSQYVRGLLAELNTAMLVVRTIESLPNGMIAHRWQVDIMSISGYRPKWKQAIVDEYGVWPERLF